MKFPALLFACLLFFTQKNSAQTNSAYHILRTIHVGGDGGWDYIAVNNGINRIYVAHSMQVNVLDKTSGDSVGVIPNVTGAHGIAFADALGKGYATAGKINSVIVFDLKTNKVLRSIKTPAGPDGIIFDSYSKKIFVSNGHAQMATVIDVAKDSVVDSIPLGGSPEEAISDGAGNIYVNIEDKNEVVHINANDFSIHERWKIGNGDSPSGLAMDREHRRLFIGCGNKLMIVMNAVNGKVIAELPTGNSCDGAAFDASRGYAFSPNGEGTLTIIQEVNPDQFKVIDNVPTKQGARTIALDESTHHLFLPVADLGETPPATKDNPRPRPKVISGTFGILEVGK
jgi:YVTN family beta-propeller protein